ncbi:mitochondrial import inner membrane translocase subunit TIM23-2-like [Carica papaya]|uniref:mitochondrial import inner membrane translocase subunit TIM23-2-like n=1 Tax=Carica papaya TaxID=3649 RepID=UPI000B8CF650|nr:mitochondrial import inner membrane translocase subunit TIM23-2-like [Carica papaya]
METVGVKRRPQHLQFFYSMLLLQTSWVGIFKLGQRGVNFSREEKGCHGSLQISSLIHLQPLHMANHTSASDHDSHPNTRLYNPYQDYDIPINTRHLFNLPTSPDFLFHEEAIRKRRPWGEDFVFYTGSAYLAGSFAGHAAGFISAIKNFEQGDTLKLRINSILNYSEQSGRLWGGRIGMIGMIYAGFNACAVAATDKDGVWTSVAAGLGTGAFYWSPRGLRSAAVAGALGGIMAGAMVGGKEALAGYLPI